jgi:mono/diheme cytochrome c family protein
MNKITNCKKEFSMFKLLFFILSFLLIQSPAFTQNGEELFATNCTACHFATADRLVGPGLAGINDKYEREWLVKFVENSTAMVEAGDAEAKAIFDEYKVPMTAFEGVLSTEEITAILDYLANPEGSSGSDEAEETGDSEDVGGGSDELIAQGEKLFKANCKACHNVGDKKVVGPGLRGINEKREKEWLVKWITNSGELIASGDGDAQAIFDEYAGSIMPPQAVTEDEITAILAYIQNPGTKVAPTAGDGANANVVVEKDNTTLKYVLGVVIALLFVLLFSLNRSRLFMKMAAAKDEGVEYDGPTTLLGSFSQLLSNNKEFVAIIVIILFFGGLVALMDGAFTIGVHQGYKPEQPIKFSHKVHAGDNKIDCNYCHSSARHSKTSGIPSLNVCMNCHKYVDGGENNFMYNGEEYPMAEEIKKIYKHLDYDPATQKYGDNPTPVKWIKVHNLPDHVYYSHEQHVTAGKQKCQTCHGPVEEMDVVEQHSSLTMKWCIECHQNTKVSTKDNGYYDDMHARMTDEYKEKVLGDGSLTVDEIGGWECAKCHY